MGELVVGQLNSSRSRGLSTEGIGSVGELIDGIRQDFSLQAAGIEARIVLLVLLVMLVGDAAALIGAAVADEPDERLQVEQQFSE